MFSNIKRRVGVITAITVLAALVPVLSNSAASAAPLAIAANGSDLATYKACPTGVAPSAGFSDTSSTDVDCIAHFGITTGVTATTYEPDSSIPRWQMALYLTRMLSKGGYTLGSGADQGFTDISGQAADIQTAINQLKQAGVTTGTTATTYGPDSNVTREQMAMFMARALNKITAGPGGQSDGTGVTTINGNGTGYNYTDIDAGGVSYEGHNSIVELYNLGVPGHDKTVTTFGPAGDINRGEMATWITNGMAHSNLRPEGLVIQTSDESGTGGFGDLNNNLHISHRDASHLPVVGTLVDVFADKTFTDTDPFTAAGACVTGFTVELGNTVTECKIDQGDTSTNASGNIAVTVNGGGAEATSGTTWTYYAWTGAVSASYNNVSAPGSSVSISSSTAAAATSVTSTIATYNQNDSTMGGDLVKYGTTITATAQLVTSLAANVSMPLSLITVVHTVQENTDDGANIDGDGGGENAASSVTTTKLYTDASGAATYDITCTDPTAAVATVTDRTEHTVVFTPTIGGATTINIQCDDNPSVDASVVVATGSKYGAGAATGVARTATATVYDQYGIGMANQTVTFENTGGTTPFTQDVTRVTDSSGVATLGYTSLQAGEAANVISGYLDTGLGIADDAQGTASDGTNHANEISGSATFYRTGTGASASESDTNAAGALGTAFQAVAADDSITFDAGAGLQVGDEIIVTTALSGQGDGSQGFDLNTRWFVITRNSDTNYDVSTTRGGTQKTVAANSGEAGGDTKGVAKLLGTADVNGDTVMELVLQDVANNTVVVAMNVFAGGSLATGYKTYTWDANDYFMTGGDTLTPTAVTEAAFETAVKAKFTAPLYTTPIANVNGDLVVANLAATTAGISTWQLGQ